MSDVMFSEIVSQQLPPDPVALARFEKVRAHRRIYLDEHFFVPARGHVSRVWLVGADFGFGCITYETLCSTSMCSDDVGEMPDWIAEFIQDVGWESVLDASRGDEHASWLFEQGVAPGQPFRVELVPHVSRCGYYGEDYDLEVEAEVIEVARWSPARVLAAWERWARRNLEGPQFGWFGG